jgi:DsbC/DsbD-like thiol-disulfide interchange protein
MKRVAGAILFFFGLVLNANAQQPVIADPTTWSYEAKKINADEYELTFKLKLEEGWHIWSLTPGGDGYEIIPSFKLDKGTAKSKLTESGHANTVLMEGVDNKVTYLSGEVEYKQVVKAKGDKITGEHEYQICNDKMCLPPKTKKFEIALNGK